MNRFISNYLFFYPATFLKGEPIAFLMNSYRNRQWLGPAELKDYQLRRLKEIVRFASKNSSFYSRRFKDSCLDDKSIDSLEDISKFPSIGKTDLIESLDEIKSGRHSLFSVSKTTGGSTGEPVKLYKNSLALARERCATARSYEWANLRIGDPQLRFWGVPHSDIGSSRARITDLIANRKRISAFDINETSLDQYYKMAEKFSPRFIYGYVSAIQELAQYIIENGLKPIPSIQSVITTSEILTDSSRIVLERAFGVKVYNEYGCGEVGSIAHECAEGGMHLMADNLLVEVEGGETGELIVTDFFNRSTPIIRYRLGDFATMSSETCKCGRGLPLIEKIHGRAYDLIKLPNGNKIHPESIIYIFENMQSKAANFKQFQVVQESLESVSINIVPNKRWENSAGARLVNDLKRNVFNGFRYTINIVDKIEREGSGKMRLVKCRI